MNRVTEQDSLYRHLDKMTTKELLININKEDHKVPQIIEKIIPNIEQLVDVVVDKMLSGGRLFYIGAGTSGRLGIVDASECPPTFGVEDGLVIGLIAGGDKAIRKAQEFAEDDPLRGWKDLEVCGINENDVVIALSQSGETADTMSALKLAKEKGALIYGIVNNVGSSIARITDCGSYIHAGPEIGVASTKAFTSQLVVLSLMALDLAHRRGTLSESDFQMLISEFELIPEKVKKVLKQADHIKSIAAEIKSASNALYLGRGYNFPIALEGALKLKEISYIHAEGYPAAEMKHGPIALIDMYMPVIVIATNKNAYEKIFSNVQEVKARKGIVIAIVSEGDTEIKNIADFTIEIPYTDDVFSPLLSAIPLQLLAYYIAVMRGCNVDQPRNLAKSVTVE